MVDETLREGVERCPFAITTQTKLAILKKMLAAGIRDFVVGCGPEQPEVWLALQQMRAAGSIPAETTATFIVLLNCWETAFENFKSMPREYVEATVFSFGMLTHQEDQDCFERAVAGFMRLGAKNFNSNSISKLHYSWMTDAPPRCTTCTISSANPSPLDALLN